MTIATQSNLTVRYMETGDISEVMYIDEESFSPPWPERSYRFELNESQVSFMLVLEKLEEQPVTGLRKILSNLRGSSTTFIQKSVIVAYGGLWKIAEEAHISTIASHPDYRGNKYGEIILVSMIKRAIALNADYIVLEVRVSNEVAQALYNKYGFEIHSIKKNYYHHDKEDAYDMRLELTEEAIAHVNNLSDMLCTHVPYKDWYSNTPHPRLGR